MNKGRRILIYLGGFIIGCVAVYFTLIRGNDRTYWLPGNRVIGQMMASQISTDSTTTCWLQCTGMDTASFKHLIQESDVNFQSSKIRGQEHPVYRFENNNKDGMVMDLQNRDSTVYILNILSYKGATIGCQCNH